jgi:nucleotide-binding universal stress UspA family protein
MDAAIDGDREKGGSMTTHTSPTGRILVGIDGSAASVPAVRWAAREAELRGMQVHVLYVREQRPGVLAHYAPRPRAGESGAGWNAGESTMKTVVNEALGPEPPPAVQMELADGLPARVLLDRAAGAEMLVLGSGQPAVPARTPLGPVARDCLHAAPCPVVVVRPDNVTSPGQPVPAR